MKSIPGADIKKLQEALRDAAKLGSRELSRGFTLGKLNLKRFHLVQKRKELLADLGRTTFDAYKTGQAVFPFSQQGIDALNRSDFEEIIKDLEQVDCLLEAARTAK